MNNTDMDQDIIRKKGKEYIDNAIEQFINELLKSITDRDCAQLYFERKLGRGTAIKQASDIDIVDVAINTQISQELLKREIGIMFPNDPTFTDGLGERNYAYCIYLLKKTPLE